MGASQRGRGAPCQLLSVFALAAALAGCMTTQGGPSSLATVDGPPIGMARIIVVRGEQTSLMLRYRDFPIKVDGEPLGNLAVGRFAYLDRPGGAHELSPKFAAFPASPAVTSWRYQDGRITSGQA